LTGHAGAVQGVAFSPDGARLVTGGADGGLKVWEAESGQGVIAFGHTAPNNQPIQPIQAIAFLNNGTLVSGSADKTLRTWTFAGAWSESKPLGPHAFRVLTLDFNPDGTLLATGGGEPSRSGEVKIWEIGKGILAKTLPDSLHSDTVFGVRFSPDGSKLATCAADKFLKVTDLASANVLKTFEGHTHHVLAVDWRDNGKQLVTGGADNVLKVWDFETGEQVRTLQAATRQVTSVRWVPGKASVVGASGDKNVRSWNADNGQVERTFSGPSDYVFGVAVSKDGSRVAAGGADSVLYLWRGDNAQVLRKFEPPAPATDAKAPVAAAKP
jgi:WD40 repeat protein